MPVKQLLFFIHIPPPGFLAYTHRTKKKNDVNRNFYSYKNNLNKRSFFHSTLRHKNIDSIPVIVVKLLYTRLREHYGIRK